MASINDDQAFLAKWLTKAQLANADKYIEDYIELIRPYKGQNREDEYKEDLEVNTDDYKVNVLPEVREAIGKDDTWVPQSDNGDEWLRTYIVNLGQSFTKADGTANKTTYPKLITTLKQFEGVTLDPRDDLDPQGKIPSTASPRRAFDKFFEYYRNF